MIKLVLVGGHPKGYPIPFHPATRSGKVLRSILENLGITPNLFNLWANDQQEKQGRLSRYTKIKLQSFSQQNFLVIALGKYQHQVLIKNGFDCLYLPHPASRRNIDRQRLKEGLFNLLK